MNANRNSTCIHNTSDELDTIAAKITNAASEEEKAAAIAEYQQKMYDDAVIVPIAQVYDYTATSSRVTGLDTSLTAHVSDNTWEWDVAE
ncbi:MAG: hypothetical protein Q4B60_07505 [Erysipelotrichaceae bacterium]|nr:hypothetical protein [Erysipelotrichaceae bacterium]